MIVDMRVQLTPFGQRMVADNTGLAYQQAFRDCPGRLDVDERISVALEALVRAVIHFNPNLGFQFSTFATWVIHREIRRATATDRVIRVAHNAFRRAPKSEVRTKADLAMAIRSLEEIDGFEPTSPEDRGGAEPEILGLLRASIGRLEPRIRCVIEGRKTRTLQAIADDLGITKERVRQLERRGHELIRMDLAGAMGCAC